MKETKGKRRYQKEFVGFNLDAWEEVGEDDKFVLFEDIERGLKRGILKDCRHNPNC